jgi:hypothetical protein
MNNKQKKCVCFRRNDWRKYVAKIQKIFNVQYKIVTETLKIKLNMQKILFDNII